METESSIPPSENPVLSAAHTHQLAVEHGIAPEVIAERQYRTCACHSELKSLGITVPKMRYGTGGLLLPLHLTDGTPAHHFLPTEQRSVPLVIYRPDEPFVDAKGKAKRYLCPKNARTHIDAPPRALPFLKDTSTFLWVTEGQKKADALVSRGACAVALLGVDCWNTLDWRFVDLRQRDVGIVFDSDVMVKAEVRRALDALTRYLTGKGAHVLHAFLPQRDGAKVGVDDFFVAGHTVHDLQALLEDSPTTKPSGPRRPLSPTGMPESEEAIPFDRTKTGEIRQTLANVLYVLEYDPAWQGALKFDLLLNDVVLCTRPPYLADTGTWTTRPVTEQDDRETANWLQRQYRLYATTTLAGEGLTTYAMRFPFHAVCQYLDGLAWDHTPRLNTWLTTYCHVQESPYVQAVASKTLIAAVARAYRPGCKVDTMCILEGGQGDLKSTVWNTLAGDAWFTDGLPDLHDKDAAQALQGKWIIEFAELAHFQRSEMETVKRFLSAKADHYRPSYGRKAATFPRHSIFVGSTNEAHYFKDNTGNRRYWPVAIGGVCDIPGLARERDQLWAEAVCRYKAGEPWYLSNDLEMSAKDEQAQRLELDDWEEQALEYAEANSHISSGHTLHYVTTLEMLRNAFHIENVLHHTQGNTKRIAGILRRNGWKSKPVRTMQLTDEKNAVQFKAFTKPCTCVTCVTRFNEEKAKTGNSILPKKDATCTCVTCVTRRSNIWESIAENGKKENQHFGVLPENHTFPGIYGGTGNRGKTGNSGNSDPMADGEEIVFTTPDREPGEEDPEPCDHDHIDTHGRCTACRLFPYPR